MAYTRFGNECYADSGASQLFVIPGERLAPFQPSAAREAVAEQLIDLHAYSNPFSDKVTVRFTVEVSGQASVELYNLQGLS